MNQKVRLPLLIITCLISQIMWGQNNLHIIKLQSQMLQLISSPNRDAFFEVTEQLKNECEKSGDERLFYTAWGYQSTYEATHLDYTSAETIVNEIADYAEAQNSHWGTYIVIRTKAMNAQQKQDYYAADEGFRKAVDFRHKYFPEESAGDDLRELLKMADHHKDRKATLKYIHLILNERNISATHQEEALNRLSQLAFTDNNKQLFDSVYTALQELQQNSDIVALDPIVEVNRQTILGHYQEALHLCNQLSPEARAEHMSEIYHRMGLHDKAYEYLSLYKSINDSMMMVSHDHMMASCFAQMNNDRLKMEQNILAEENAHLRQMINYIIGGALLLILGIVVCMNFKRIRSLEKSNAQLDKAVKKAEKAFNMKNEFITQITKELREPLNPIEGFSDILGTTEYELLPDEREELSRHIRSSAKHITKLIDELAELSLYESKRSLPITYTLSPNHIFRHMVDSMRSRCKPGVRMFFESDLPDNFMVEHNQEAIKTLMKHLLDNAVQYTDHGSITVSCTEYDNKVRASVTDTGRGIPSEQLEHVFDIFTENGDCIKLNGLGLPICKAIVKLCGGSIWVDTDYHEGTRFVFELPRRRENE